MKRPFLTTSLILAGIVALPAPDGLAAVLGDVASVSAIGEPLRVEIHVQPARSDDIGNCVRIRAPSETGDGIAVLRTGHIGTIGHGAQTRIVVTQPAPIFEPAVRLALEDVCDTRLRREYTLLLAFPGEVATALAGAPETASARPAPRRPAAGAPRSGRTWATAPGESLDSLAHALYPDDAQLRRRFIAAALRNNPEIPPAASANPLPPGTELRIPDLDRLAATALPPRRAERPVAAARDAAPARRSAGSGAMADRLVLAGQEEAAPSDRARSAADELRLREARLVAAIDRSIDAQLELLERVRRLEDIHAALTAQLEAQIRQAPPSPAAASTRPTLAADIAAAPAARETRAPSSGWRYVILFAALAAALAFVLPRLRTRDRAPEPTLPVPTGDGAYPAPARPRADARDAPEDAGAVTQGLAAAIPEPHLASLDWDLASGASSTGKLAPILLDEESAEEHESAIELAEIMMGFGRVHGAAETLAEFIHSNPKQAVTPWLKLLEVYRAAGLRPEFDGLARQLNKTFNVKAVTWETFDEARQTHYTLEQMPHVTETVQKLWGTRDCQAYLQTLLRDNRDGTRQGFPLAVIDEILLLSSVLEQEVGAYRPADATPDTSTRPAPEKAY
jgi:hypothetical protein